MTPALVSRLSPEAGAALTLAGDTILTLDMRLNFIECVHAALRKAALDKPFFVANLALYWAILGEREMVAIELASWAKGFYSDGGLLACLTGADLAVLDMAWTGGNPPGVTPDLVASQVSTRSKAFTFLFPRAPGAAPIRDDVSILGCRLHREFKSLRDDRNKFRAHKHEFDQRRGSAVELDVAGLRAHVGTCERLVQSILYLASDTWWSLLNNRIDPDRPEARDVVDLILLGTIGWMTVFGPLQAEADGGGKPISIGWYEARRDAFYQDLHAKDGARSLDVRASRAFNDPAGEVEDQQGQR